MPNEPEDADPEQDRPETQSPIAVPNTEDLIKRLGANHAFQIDPAVLRSLDAISALDVDWDALLPPAALARLGDVVAQIRPINLPPSYWEGIELTRRLLLDSVSVPSFYPLGKLAGAFKSSSPERARATRSPEEFFSQNAVEITSLPELLKTLSVVQSKQLRHRPIWRGQVNAKWAVHSSLHRRLETRPVTENRLVAAETSALTLARQWGIPTSHALKFLADLQHNGAPTRLMDVTTDPEIAAWFAVENDPENEDEDGLVIGWGRIPILKAGIAALPDDQIDDTALPFWHLWTNDDDRRRVDWGTGTRTWTWFPPALNERMRAQRAGFLLEAGAILTDEIIRLFSDSLDQDWRESEIMRATSVIGLPTRHDVLTRPNAANLVPMFVLRIAAGAKGPIRDYLEGKGLHASSIYPDLPGLVSFLRGPFGPGA